ncbi:MAG: hypothetical protein A2V66_04170 [Ignavibacteria bacterium RBG_13_36_8]|nr:MAG: hypothetical protein A2V66_04170 [Ignavibacteria bacterium RBG_13_36_8]
MIFRSEIDLPKSDLVIEHNNRITTVGSCFAENISQNFIFYRFDVLGNPFGVLYNPASIFNSIKLLSDRKVFKKEDLFFDQGEWHSFYHHSDFSNHNADACLEKINEELVKTRKYFETTDVLIITYGTSYVYKHRERNIIVSNCHKIPAAQFDRLRLNMNETNDHIESTYKLLKEINNNIKIIFSVSPVRHWKNGAVDNQLSKSVLLMAVHEAIKEKGDCVYFPAYEILMDDLRDYRFYESDLVHPNKIAVEYIWEKFVNAHLTDSCKNVLMEIEPLAKAIFHRPRNIFSDNYKNFILNQLNLIERLRKKYYYINLKEEEKYFQKQLKEIQSYNNRY